jgi:hypothetical protein
MVAGLLIWMAFSRIWHNRQYLPGPVSQSHATFGDRCDNCHDAFHAVRNEACQRCHALRVHSEFEARTPRCRECHVEHRPVSVFLSVSNRTCVECHGNLRSSRPSGPLIHTNIGTFAGHPQFLPLRDGGKDEAAVRFNHKIHLTSDKISRDQVGPTGRLQCGDCHQRQADGERMKPIHFEEHCRRCHEQQPPNPIGSISAPHSSPEIVRESLTAQLLVLGVQNAETIFVGRDVPLPGRAPRPPVDQSRTLREYQEKWLETLEAVLYRPFDPTPSLLEHNKYCFLCHIQEGSRVAGELPHIQKTDIPRRWLKRAQFSHRHHDLLDCKTCHAAVAQSEQTSDVNLPNKGVCQKCHVDDSVRSAGTDCMLCHLYHDTSKDMKTRALKQKVIAIDLLTGRSR